MSSRQWLQLHIDLVIILNYYSTSTARFACFTVKYWDRCRDITVAKYGEAESNLKGQEKRKDKNRSKKLDAFWTCPETRTASLVQWLLLVSGHQVFFVRNRKAWANERAGRLVGTAATNLNTASVLQEWLTQEHERNAELRITVVKQNTC